MSQPKSNEEIVKAIRPKLLPTEAEMDLYEREVIELLAQKDAEVVEAVKAERERIQKTLLQSLLKPDIDAYQSHQVYLAVERERGLQAKVIKSLTHPTKQTEDAN